MKLQKFLLTTSLVVTTTVSAFAQFTQLPDFSANNAAVRATFTTNAQPNQPKPANPIVGDDWQATFNGPVTQIAIWGSWLNDAVDPNVTFKLSIHRDNPPGSGGVPWSRPGQEIWNYVGAATDASLKMNGISGNFYDFTTVGNPLQGTYSTATYYDFKFGANAFVAQANVTYWLVVQATTADGKSFAWNSSYQHNYDAAVFGNNSSFGSTRVVFNPLDPLYDPAVPQHTDLAFTIAPEPSSFALLGLGLAALLMRRKVG